MDSSLLNGIRLFMSNPTLQDSLLTVSQELKTKSLSQYFTSSIINLSSAIFVLAKHFQYSPNDALGNNYLPNSVIEGLCQQRYKHI